ncbi:MAG TPA: hypothetical protein VHM28_09190 [Anaerolineales bacterium]|jgi:hypothetical protein|nr:hypothetical protein [Anaerolineales bacterium]
MVKRFFAERGWIFTVGILVIAAIIVSFYHRMQNAKKDLEDYRLAASCPSEANCRKKVQATVLQSRALNLDFHGIRTRPLIESIYSIEVSSPITGEQIVDISSRPPYNGTVFDIAEVYIPTGSDSKFIKENFYISEKIYVEVWHHKITFLYLNTVLDVPDYVIQPTSDPNAKEIITSNPLPEKQEIALPTTNHPVLLQAGTEQEFGQMGLICVIAMIFLCGLIGKEINWILNKVFRIRKPAKENL